MHAPRTLIGAAAATVLLSAHLAAQESPTYPQLYDALWSAVNEHFYDPHFRGADWAGMRERYRARAQRVETDADFRALAAAMLAEVRSSHLHVAAPARAPRTVGIGARTEELGGARLVSDVLPLSDARRQGLRPGDRLLTPDAELQGELGTDATVEVERCDGRRETLRIRREREGWPPERPGLRWTRLQTGPGATVGLLAINRFDDGAAELADQAMEELRNAHALVIDLRENSGGNVSALRLASYFGPGAEPAVVLLARPYLDALERPVTAADAVAAPRVSGAYTTAAVFEAMTRYGGGAAFWTDSVAPRFERPVFLLIGEETASAAEGFAWYMRDRTHAVLVGRPTAGALLSAETIPLGGGWGVTVPVHGIWGPDGADYGDRAVPPHEAVAWTRADLCAGRDPDLERALSLARGG